MSQDPLVVAFSIEQLFVEIFAKHRSFHQRCFFHEIVWLANDLRLANDLVQANI